MTEAKSEETITRGEYSFPVTTFLIEYDRVQEAVPQLRPWPSSVEDVFERYGKTPDLARFTGEIGMKGEPILGDMPLPYKMVVDYTSPVGQDVFARTVAHLSNNSFKPKGLAGELGAFCRAAYPYKFASDARLMCVRDAHVMGENRMTLTISPGEADDTHYSNGMDGADASIDEVMAQFILKEPKRAEAARSGAGHLLNMSESLIMHHGRKTVGQILYEQGYRLPAFADGVMNNSIRLQLSLLTCDGEFLCAKRSEGIGNLVVGDARLNRVVQTDRREGDPSLEELQATLDAVVFEEGFPHALARQAARLLRETLGIRDCALMLGNEAKHVPIVTDMSRHFVPRMELFCTGFVRNLTLGGQPEFHFMARTGLTTNQAIARLKAHILEGGCPEIDGDVVAISLSKVDAAIKSGFFHHSAAMNLALAHKFHSLR